MRPVLVVLLAGFPVFLVILLVSFRLFDELLRVQFSNAYSEWQRCDHPSGYFWKPPGSRGMSLKQRGNLWSYWYWYRPAWVDCSEDSGKLYRRFRLVGHLTTLAFAPVFGASCFLAMVALVKSIEFVAGHVFG